MNRRDGFTLIEVLISVAILAIIATLLAASFRQSFRTTERVLADGVPYDRARGVFEIVGRELSSAVWKTTDPMLVFRGREETAGRGRADVLTFTTDGHLRVVPEAAETSRSKVMYFLETGDREGSFRLVHQEEANLLSRTPATVQAEALADDVASFGLDYFDGATWRRSWDAVKETRLPQAVRVTLTFAGRPGGETGESFTTIFTLPSLSPGA